MVSSPVSLVFLDKQVHSNYRYCFAQIIPLNQFLEYLVLWIFAADCGNSVIGQIVVVEMLKVVVLEIEKEHVAVTDWKD